MYKVLKTIHSRLIDVFDYLSNYYDNIDERDIENIIKKEKLEKLGFLIYLIEVHIADKSGLSEDMSDIADKTDFSKDMPDTVDKSGLTKDMFEKLMIELNNILYDLTRSKALQLSLNPQYQKSGIASRL